MTQYDAIILGAGAAGLFCAAEATRRGRRVIVLDHAQRPRGVPEELQRQRQHTGVIHSVPTTEQRLVGLDQLA